jgi:hypothetical protein
VTGKKKDDFTVNANGVNDLLNGLSDRFGTEPPVPGTGDGTTASRQNGATARRRNGRTAPEPPKADPPKPSKYTLLLDSDDALILDQLALELRRLTGRRIEKSEIMRALIRRAYTDRPTADALVAALDRRPKP